MSSHSSSSTVLTESVVGFLEKIPPFQFLPAPEIRSLARTMTLEYFPKDTVILAAGRQMSESLYGRRGGSFNWLGRHRDHDNASSLGRKQRTHLPGTADDAATCRAGVKATPCRTVSIGDMIVEFVYL